MYLSSKTDIVDIMKKLPPKPRWSRFDKIYLFAEATHSELQKVAHLAKGKFLDVGGTDTLLYDMFSPFIKKYVCVNIKKVQNRADENVIGSATELPFGNASFETIHSSSVLEHIDEPQKAVDETYRVLKKGGYCILTTNMAWIYHPDPKDYYRFTKDGLKYLFRNFSKVEVREIGGSLLAIAQLEVLAWSKVPVLGKICTVILNLIAPTLDRWFYDKKLSMNMLVIAKK